MTELKGKLVICKERKYTGKGPTYYEETTYQGEFLKWGLSTEEDERGFTNHTIGIVLLKDGQIKSFLPDNIKVIEGDKHKI